MVRLDGSDAVGAGIGGGRKWAFPRIQLSPFPDRPTRALRHGRPMRPRPGRSPGIGASRVLARPLQFQPSVIVVDLQPPASRIDVTLL